MRLVSVFLRDLDNLDLDILHIPHIVIYLRYLKVKPFGYFAYLPDTTDALVYLASSLSFRFITKS